MDIDFERSKYCFAFLQKYNLLDSFKMNIEANHATLAGHDFCHELAFCAANGILGSVDANRGDLLLGWDTDQFPRDIAENNHGYVYHSQERRFYDRRPEFHAHVRRQSIDTDDLFYAHMAKGILLREGLRMQRS